MPQSSLIHPPGAANKGALWGPVQLIKGGPDPTVPGVFPPYTNPAPQSEVPPIAGGSIVQGGTVTVTTGTWSGPPTSYTYQWHNGAGAIAGATQNNYVTTAADVGTTLACLVTARNAGGSGSAYSNPLGIITVLAATDAEPTPSLLSAPTPPTSPAPHHTPIPVKHSHRPKS